MLTDKKIYTYKPSCKHALIFSQVYKEITLSISGWLIIGISLEKEYGIYFTLHFSKKLIAYSRSLSIINLLTN